MATEIWVNIGSGNGLMPDGTKPLPEPMLTNDQWDVVTFTHLIAISHKILKIFIVEISLKFTNLRLELNPPGAMS